MVLLSEKQKIFCDEYLIDFNATRSYKVAYGENLSDNTAAVEGSKLIRNPKVSKYLSKRIRKRQERTEITQDLVVRELAKIALADVTEVVNAKGGNRVSVNDTKTLSDNVKAAIKSIKPGRNGVEVEFNDKLKALELLGKHLGMFTDKFEVNSQLGVTIVDDIPSGDGDE